MKTVQARGRQKGDDLFTSCLTKFSPDLFLMTFGVWGSLPTFLSSLSLLTLIINLRIWFFTGLRVHRSCRKSLKVNSAPITTDRIDGINLWIIRMAGQCQCRRWHKVLWNTNTETHSSLETTVISIFFSGKGI